jgi:RimJ/RimL family protein N-acetyltransferase
MALSNGRGYGLGESSRHIIETERLVLRAPRPLDAPMIAALVNDRRIAENTARIPHPYRLADAEDWITLANADPRDEVLLITLRDGTVAGVCGLEWRDAPNPEIGYWLGVPYWGHGYATEAVRALIDQAFGDLGHEAVEAGARTTNAASRRVLEKCGFQWTGVGLYRIRAINSSAPFDRFCLERRIWASLKRWGKATHRVRHVA